MYVHLYMCIFIYTYIYVYAGNRSNRQRLRAQGQSGRPALRLHFQNRAGIQGVRGCSNIHATPSSSTHKTFEHPTLTLQKSPTFTKAHSLYAYTECAFVHSDSFYACNECAF